MSYVKGLRNRAKSVGSKIRMTEFLMQVGDLSFSTAFSIVPTFALMLAIADLMGDLGLVMESFRPELLTSLGFSQDLVDQLTASLSTIHFSELGILSFLGLLYISTNLISSVDIAIHRIWQERSRQLRIKRILLFWSILFFLPLFIVSFIGAFSYEIVNSLIIFPQKILPIIGWSIGILMLNKYVPYERVYWRAALISSVVASLLLWLLKGAFFWASGEIFNYSRIYGSVAFLPLLLLWIKLIWQVILGSVIFCRLLHFNMLKNSPLFQAED